MIKGKGRGLRAAVHGWRVYCFLGLIARRGGVTCDVRLSVCLLDMVIGDTIRHVSCIN